MSFLVSKRKNNYNYFDGFEANASYSLECAKIIYEVLINFEQNKIGENLVRIHEIERKADDGKHAMINYLVKDFLPPIEREDIIELSQQIDNVTDIIEEILINVDIFNVTTIREDSIAFLELLLQCCKSEYELLSKFKNLKKTDEIEKIVIEINALEEQGDVLYVNAMKKLYRDGTDTLDITKWTTIYSCFENCFDICEHVANEVENIMLKNL